MGGPKKKILVSAIVILVIVAGTTLGLTLAPSRGHVAKRHGPTAQQLQITAETKAVTRAEKLIGIGLPSAVDDRSPTWSSQVFVHKLAVHQVIGYLPWYELGTLSQADYTDVTAIAYSGVDVSQDGGLVESGREWQALQSQSLTSLVTTAHGARDEVLLSIFSQTKPVVDSLARHPSASASHLASAIVPLLASDHFDGLSIDIEGQWYKDRTGFSTFVHDFVRDVKASDPTAVFLLDTYVDSAANPTGFFDLSTLAPSVDLIFVMGYDMETPGVASPNAPLANPNLGYSDVQTIEQYLTMVPPAKLVLGMPFYGLDFKTKSSLAGAHTVNNNPTAVTWSAILASGHVALWDPQSLTPWYRFKEGRQWHETWFDNPASIALKTALASQFHLGGVGVWALGMEGSDTTMLDALLGGQPPVKELAVGGS